MPFHFFFHGCCARFWSIWGIHQILSWSASVFAERYLLSTSGSIWQHIELSSQGGHSQLRYQLPGEHLHVIYLWVYPLPLLPYPKPLQLLQPHQSHLLQLSQGWPYPFQNIESYAAHCRPSPHLKAALLRRWQLFKHARSRCWPPRLSTLPSWGSSSIISIFHQLLSIPPPPLQCHTRRPQSLRPLQKKLLKRQNHLPKLSAPAPSTHLIIYIYIYIYFKFLLCISLLLLFYEIPSFRYHIWDCLYCFVFACTRMN